MNNEEKILSLLKTVVERLDKMDGRLDKLEAGQGRLEGIVTRIENDHGTKLNALHDGYKQNAERLDRIEAKVSSQDDIILKRVFPKTVGS